MKALFIVLALLTGIRFDGLTQTSNFFKLRGEIDIDTGHARILPQGSFSFYKYNLKNAGSGIVNGRFAIQGMIDCPTGVRVGVYQGESLLYVTDFFLLDTGVQSVQCHVDSAHEEVEIRNQSSSDLRILKLGFAEITRKRERINDLFDSLKQVQKGKESDSLALWYFAQKKLLQNEQNLALLSLAQKNPTSFAVLWYLGYQITIGYDTAYESAYHSLDSRVKNSFTGRAIFNQIKRAKTLQVGSKVPRIEASKLDGSNRLVILNLSRTKFSLVEFWFSSCGPCLSQFDGFQKLNLKYRGDRLSIFGITVDDARHIEQSKKVILSHRLSWPQYWDRNGELRKHFQISVYPTNYLIDRTGRIVAKDLTPAALGAILKTSSL